MSGSNRDYLSTEGKDTTAAAIDTLMFHFSSLEISIHPAPAIHISLQFLLPQLQAIIYNVATL